MVRPAKAPLGIRDKKHREFGPKHKGIDALDTSSASAPADTVGARAVTNTVPIPVDELLRRANREVRDGIPTRSTVNPMSIRRSYMA
ncbi:hypothetical protein NPX13_g1264 [Xylaria arbuscula]|uniref:Uncharacterized protein n=1 Tax=Xylaria arbuscula TaxID=114810 RepID=A0A9W8NN20_9PEZI|nr:hypothetical protein NPX13_g1264 [Xylaria arbuscula]